MFDNIDNAGGAKRKRRPAGTPDPDAEVVSLSPRTLLESDRYVCEICNQGFQRDQNLQMHRRRHKVPWKLLKRDPSSAADRARKRVFVCPEPTCLHHDPRHALGDLVGIKKHYRRKHSGHRQWACARCAKAYAVQSDYKAHLKTCGTRGHSCDCGRVFSRVESFIEHQDACTGGGARAASSPSCPSSDTNFSAAAAQMWPGMLRIPITPAKHRELQLLPTISDARQISIPSSSSPPMTSCGSDDVGAELGLSIGPSASPVEKLKDEAREQLRLAEVEKAATEKTRMQARIQMETAEREFAEAKRLRLHAQAEFSNACAVRDRAIRDNNFTLMQITCQACKSQFWAKSAENYSTSSLVTKPVDDVSMHIASME